MNTSKSSGASQPQTPLLPSQARPVPVPLTDRKFETLDSSGSMDNYERFEAMTEHAKSLERANAGLVASLREASELMPLGTAKRARWLVRATDILVCQRGGAALK